MATYSKKVRSLYSICVAYVAYNLNVEIIKHSLFLIPKRQLLRIIDHLYQHGYSFDFSKKFLKAVEDRSKEFSKPTTWSDFVSNVITTSIIDKCAIIYSTQDSTTLLSVSQNFDISETEANTFSNKSNMMYGQSNSVTISGIKYILFSQHPAMFFGKSVLTPTNPSDSLCCIAYIENGKGRTNVNQSTANVNQNTANVNQNTANVNQNAEMFILLCIVDGSGMMDDMGGIYEMQQLGAVVTFYSRYIAEYFAYIAGTNISCAASEFV